jgi:hypothetical protein
MLTSYICGFTAPRIGQLSSMHAELRFDDLDLREEPARFEADEGIYSITNDPKSNTCSVSCMTCVG